MTWGNPPPFKAEPAKPSKIITPESLAGDSESSHQKALFAWAALSVGKYPCLTYMFAIPNGGLRDIRTASTLKAEGVKSGVPDIFLPCPIQTRSGCFIEMKLEKYRNRKNGGCSDEQIEYRIYLQSYGYYYEVCYSWIEAKETLIGYLEGRL